jgi:hypothetical protein
MPNSMGPAAVGAVRAPLPEHARLIARRRRRGGLRDPFLVRAIGPCDSPRACAIASSSGGCSSPRCSPPSPRRWAAATAGRRAPRGRRSPIPAGTGSGSTGSRRPTPALVLATVGDREITLGQFAAELDRGALLRTRYRSPERRRELLDQMIRVELLAQEAARRGYDQLPEVQRGAQADPHPEVPARALRRRGRGVDPAGGRRGLLRGATARTTRRPRSAAPASSFVRERRLAQRLLRELEDDADGQRFRELVREHSVDEVTAAPLRGPRLLQPARASGGPRSPRWPTASATSPSRSSRRSARSTTKCCGRTRATRSCASPVAGRRCDGTLESVSQPIRNRAVAGAPRAGDRGSHRAAAGRGATSRSTWPPSTTSGWTCRSSRRRRPTRCGRPSTRRSEVDAPQ